MFQSQRVRGDGGRHLYRAQLVEGAAGRFLLGLLLGGARTVSDETGGWVRARQAYFHYEALAMVGPAFGRDGVLRGAEAAGLQQLLERRFVVADVVALFQIVVEAADIRGDHVALDEEADGADAGVQVERGDDGLNAVGEERVFSASAAAFFPAAEAHEFA